MIENKFINYLKSNQPYRFIGKSIMNCFFPLKDLGNIVNTVSIEISSICNANCIFCIYRYGYRKKQIISVEEFKKIAVSAINLGYENLDLTSPSGELFTNRSVIEIIRTAKNAGFKHIGTYTNGILLYKYDMYALLTSGINALLISFPGFDRNLYLEIFQADKLEEFEKSIIQLLETHKKIDSKVIIILEPRTYLSVDKIRRGSFYENVVSKFTNDIVFIREPLRIFDSWCGEIKKEDLIKGMKIDICPMKSIYPLKKTYPCLRIFMVGVLVNGDVRLCNCRYDRTIGTDEDSLFIGNLYDYENLEELIDQNVGKIEKIRYEFCSGRIPRLCRKCPFYRPLKMS